MLGSVEAARHKAVVVDGASVDKAAADVDDSDVEDMIRCYGGGKNFDVNKFKNERWTLATQSFLHE